jgi:hypothetical protein
MTRWLKVNLSKGDLKNQRYPQLILLPLEQDFLFYNQFLLSEKQDRR